MYTDLPEALGGDRLVVGIDDPGVIDVGNEVLPAGGAGAGGGQLGHVHSGVACEVSVELLWHFLHQVGKVGWRKEKLGHGFFFTYIDSERN